MVLTELLLQLIKEKPESRDSKKNRLKEGLIRDSLTCRCKGTAIPVCGTANKYECLKCGSRFGNVKHNFSNKDTFYIDVTIFYEEVRRDMIQEAQR